MEGIARRIFGNVEKVRVNKGVVYYPLLTDPKIEQRLHSNGTVKKNGRGFEVKGIELQSAVGSYSTLHPEEYEAFRKEVLKGIGGDKGLKNLSKKDELLETILFEVMPHFVEKRNRGLGINPSKNEILSLIRHEIKVPKSYYQKAVESYKPTDNRSIIDKLNKEITKTKINKLKGEVSLKELDYFVSSSLKAKILYGEREKLKSDAEYSKSFAKEGLEDLATLLFLQDQKSFDLDDFGFIKKRVFRDEYGNKIEGEFSDYTVYVKVPEHALRDFDGEVYLLPKCRVAVDINGSSLSSQFALGKYDHPFLISEGGYDSEICIGRAKIHGKSLSEKLRGRLEAGKNALLYGYFDNSGDFNPASHLGNGDFKRISEKNSKIMSGRVKITNDPFIKVEKKE